ncbi:MAG: translation initiation factor IF-5A [Candidatus Nanoarchaeia archaeon]|nr:translation initiation factor IF-5A [Candidatus Nanoarchaeia archaeon]
MSEEIEGDTRETTATSLRPGRFVILNGVACKVTKIDISKTGKHGHAKCKIEASGILDDKKVVVILPGHDAVKTPIIEKKTAQVLSVNGKMANVMDIESYETFDLEVPEEINDQVKEGVQVMYWVVTGVRVMKQLK